MASDRDEAGSFSGLLKAYYAAQPQQYSYLAGPWADFEQWKAMARSKVFELLRYFPAEAPLSPELIERRDAGSYWQEEVEFNTSALSRVQGTVLIPKDGNATHPAIVAIHDHGGVYFWGREKIIRQQTEAAPLEAHKNACYGARSWASDLAERGFLVLCIDGFYFGSRRPDLNLISDAVLDMCPVKPREHEPGSDSYIQAFNGFCSWYEGLLVKHILYAGTTWPGMLLHDDRKSIDYLCSRADVDKTRLGSCGLSIGGFRSAHLAALDSRIRCAVVAGWMPTADSLLCASLKHHTYMVYIPSLTNYMDVPDIAGLTAPNFLMVQQCSKDSLYPLQGMRDSCDKIQAIFAKAGCADHFASRFYDCGHEFNVEMQEDAFAWLHQHLTN